MNQIEIYQEGLPANAYLDFGASMRIAFWLSLVISVFFLVPHAHAQSPNTMEKCISGQCYGYGQPDSTPAKYGFIYQDVSVSPPALYCPRNGVWIACGGSGGTTPVGQQFRIGAYTGPGSGGNFQLGQSN